MQIVLIHGQNACGRLGFITDRKGVLGRTRLAGKRQAVEKIAGALQYSGYRDESTKYNL